MKELQILKEVLSLPTAPLFEHFVIRYVKKFAEELGYECLEDIYGNLIFEYRYGPTIPALGIVAHMDHPGFEISGMEENLIKLTVRGGIARPQEGDSLNLFHRGQELKVRVEKIIDNDNGRPAFVLASGAEISDAQGFGMFDLVPFEHKEQKIYSRAIDDLAGCAAMLALLKRLAEKRPTAHVYIIFTRAEEIGFVGACGLAMSRLLKDHLPIISLEASKKLPGAEQGKGVVIRIGDRRTIFDTALTSFLDDVATKLCSEKENFLFQKRLLDGGTCEASLFASFDYPTAGLAVPLGCYHNNGENSHIEPEYIHLADWHAMVDLLWHAVTSSESLNGRQESMRAGFVKSFQKYRNGMLNFTSDVGSSSGN